MRDWVRNDQKPVDGKPLVLLADWIDGIEPVKLLNGGFAEAAADAMFASLVQLDQKYNGTVGSANGLYDADGNLIRQQGDIFNVPSPFFPTLSRCYPRLPRLVQLLSCRLFYGG